MPIQRPRILHSAQMAGTGVVSPSNLNATAQGGSGNKNLAMNGAMTVSQRATSVSSITGAGYHVLDRHRLGGAVPGTWTMSQSTTVPSGQGFAKSLKLDCTATGSAGSMYIQHKIEGQDLQHLKKGTSSAETTTLSFWVRSNKTGTYIAQLLDYDNTRHISKAYTISAANTWEHKKITFPGDTTGALDNDNAGSLEIYLWLSADSSNSDGTLATSWASVTAANNAVGQVNLADDTANEWYLTGLQLEVGDVATAFEHESFDVTLRKCNRYFEKVEVTAGSYAHINYAYTTTEMRAVLSYEKKRANPTFSFDNQGDVVVFYNGSSSDTNPNWNYHDAGPNSCRVSTTLTGVSTTAGYATASYVNGSVTYNIKVDAEL